MIDHQTVLVAATAVRRDDSVTVAVPVFVVWVENVAWWMLESSNLARPLRYKRIEFRFNNRDFWAARTFHILFVKITIYIQVVGTQ